MKRVFASLDCGGSAARELICLAQCFDELWAVFKAGPQNEFKGVAILICALNRTAKLFERLAERPCQKALTQSFRQDFDASAGLARILIAETVNDERSIPRPPGRLGKRPT